MNAPPPPSLAALLDALAPGMPPPPDQVDRDFRLVAARWRAADEAERQALRRGVTVDSGRGLWVLAERAAEWALNEGDPAHVDDALDAMAMEDFRWDPRDSIIRLAMIWHAAEALKAGPRKRFTAAAERAGPGTREQLLQFSRRSKALRGLEVFGLEVVEEAGRKWFGDASRPARGPKTD